MEAVVAPARRDIDRDVAHDPDAALGPVRAQRAPLAIEANLVVDRPPPREPLPIADPECLALPELAHLRAGYRCPRLREQALPRGEGRARLVRRAVAIRRPHQQDLPP